MTDDLSDLRLFTRLVAAGNLSEAARRLNSSPPAMSRRLAAMEARLGVRLVDRSSRRFSLTEEGAILHERGLHILAELDDAEAEASMGTQTPRGHLRVRAPMQIGRRRIAPMVGDFVQQFPKVMVELILSDAEPDLADEDLDVVFKVGPPEEPNLIARRLTPDRQVVICAAPRYFEKHGTPMEPNDLLKHNCILLVRGRRIFDHWLFTENGARREVHVHGNLSTTSGDVVLGWALAGLGIALRLRWDVCEALQSGALVACLEPYAQGQRSLHLVYASKSHMPPRIRAFLDFAIKNFRDGVI